MLNITSEYQKGILFVRLKGVLNKKTAHKLKNYLLPVIIKQGIKFLVYNLYSLEQIDFSGKKALEKCSQAIKENNGKALICEIPLKLNDSIANLEIKKTKNELTAIKLIQI